MHRRCLLYRTDELLPRVVDVPLLGHSRDAYKFPAVEACMGEGRIMWRKITVRNNGSIRSNGGRNRTYMIFWHGAPSGNTVTLPVNLAARQVVPRSIIRGHMLVMALGVDVRRDTCINLEGEIPRDLAKRALKM